MSLPDWVEPVADYMFTVGLKGTLQIAAWALLGSTVIGLALGTLLTIDFRPTRWLIRFYIEVWRGLPILVTVFIIFFALPSVAAQLTFSPETAAAIGLTLWGAPRSRRRHGARCSRSPASSTRRRQHWASAGSAGMRS